MVANSFFLSADNLIIANGLSYAFEQSSLPGLIICIVLIALSCVSWAVMATKFRMVRRVSRENAAFLSAYRDHHEPLQVLEGTEAESDAPTARLFRAGGKELLFHLSGAPAADGVPISRSDLLGKLKPSHMEPVEAAMERSIGANVGRMESQMGVLATAVSGAPFLGLLGTVWGVMDTFGSVAAAEGAASLKTMAPGVSSALLTTVVALLVAIPAMFGYNYLVNRIKGAIAELENFRNEMRTDFERWYVDHGRPLSDPVGRAQRLSATDLIATPEVKTSAPSHRVVKRERDEVAASMEDSLDDAEEMDLELDGMELGA